MISRLIQRLNARVFDLQNLFDMACSKCGKKKEAPQKIEVAKIVVTKGGEIQVNGKTYVKR